MKHDNVRLEAEIQNVMNGISDRHWFSEDIEPDNFQLIALLDFFEEISGKKILDIGCGRGRFLKDLHTRGAIMTGIDLSDKLIEGAKKNVPGAHFTQGSATALPFHDEEFDLVYSIETFEHIPDSGSAIAEACRVLKPGGKILIIDKNRYSLHPDLLIPTNLRKKILEQKNQWVYPKEFHFKEKYFVKKDLDHLLQLHCRENLTTFLPGFRPGPRLFNLSQKWPRLVRYKTDFTNKIYYTLPFLSLFIAWKWRK